MSPRRRCARRRPAARRRFVSDGRGTSPRSCRLRSSAPRSRCARGSPAGNAARPRYRRRRGGSRPARRRCRDRPGWRRRRRRARSSHRPPRRSRWRDGIGSSLLDEPTGDRRIRSTAAWRVAPWVPASWPASGRYSHRNGRAGSNDGKRPRVCAAFTPDRREAPSAGIHKTSTESGCAPSGADGTTAPRAGSCRWAKCPIPAHEEPR